MSAHTFLDEGRRLLALFLLAALILGGAVLLGSMSDDNQEGNYSSVEINIREHSPLGTNGGAVIPASCPSYAHTPGECTPPSFSGRGSGGGSGSGPGSSISINAGDNVTLTWACSSEYNTGSSGQNFSTGGVVSGSTVVSPSNTITYTAVCNDSGSSADVTVTVLNPTLSISASPTRVRSGSASIITWSAQQVQSCSVTGPGGSLGNGHSGSQSTGALTSQSTYTLSCATQGGSVNASVTVMLAPSFEEI